MKVKFLLSLLIAGSLTAAAQSQGYKDGIEYYKAGQYDNAKTILTRTLNDPTTDQSLAYYYLGQTALAQGDKATAKADFDKGVAANADCAYNYVGLGALDLLAGNADAASDNFKKAQNLAKKNAEVSVAIARAYYNADPVKYAKEMDKAMTKARKDSKNTEPAIYVLEGDMLFDQKDWGGAAAKYESAITFDENNPEGYVKYANTYFQVNPKYAITKLEEFQQKQPNSALAQRELAEKYYQNNQWYAAADQYGKYIQNPNHFPEDKARYSVLLYYGEKYPESLKVADEILSTDPSNFMMQRVRLLNLAAMKDNEAAVKQAEAFFNGNPNGKFNDNDYVVYADVLTDMGQDSLALIQYEKAAQIAPDNGELLKNLSTIYTNNKQFVKAAEAYDAYLSKLEQPSLNDYFAASGRYLNAAVTLPTDALEQRQQLSKRGMEYIQKVIDGAEADPSFLQRKARFYLAANGNKPDQQAIDTYGEMVTLLDSDPTNMSNPEQLNLYKEAYQFMWIFYKDIAKDEAKASEYAAKFKEVNDLLNPAPAAE